MSGEYWEHFPHQADMGVRGSGPTLAAAFEQAALAMSAIVTDLAWVAADKAVEIRCEAPDDELLPVDWLNALILEIAVRHMLFSRFEVTLNGQCLRYRVGRGGGYAKHQPQSRSRAPPILN
jgi:tRNA nucleotidyltransferase (CCA-adding enzyme)